MTVGDIKPVLGRSAPAGQKTGPLWRLKELGEAGEPGVYWYHSSDNGSPRITTAFLERQRRLLLPMQYAREHENRWVDHADSFVSQAEVDAAMGTGWAEQTRGTGAPSVLAVDIGVLHDATVCGVGRRGPDGRIYIDRLVRLQGSREAPVQMATIEQHVRDLDAAFAPVTKIRIESWQGMGMAQSLTRLGKPVELYTPTAKSHAEEWPLLAQALAAGTLVLPPHPRLREELLGLSYEVGATGVKVTDRGAVHQDHAVVVRMIVAALAARGPVVDAAAAMAWAASMEGLTTESHWRPLQHGETR